MPESAQKVIHELTAAGLLSSAEITKFDEDVKVGVDALLERLVTEERITKYQAEKFKAGQSSDIYFGDYIVLEELGRGGMGTVLLAKHRRMDREVAIKILPVTALDSEASVARFYQEVKVAAQLTHPNIVHAYDAGEHHGFHYLVMEYVRGHDLARVLEHMGPVPVTLALDYLIQAAQGLEYAHRKGIVHRDIKPSNLLLDNEGVVKILDMGLARLGKGIGGAEASMHLTTTGQIMGTVEYMPPEQAEDTRLADERSDIYSLGCTLYRLITGIAPFARDTVVKTILAHREAAIPAFGSEKHPELAKLDPLFQRMVAKNPNDRIQNATLLVQELRRISQATDFSSSDVVLVEDVEIVERGSTPAEFPTQTYGSTDRSEIEYTSEVVSSTPPPVGHSQNRPDAPTIAAGHSSNVGAGRFANSPNSNPYAAPPTPIGGSLNTAPTVFQGKPHRGLLLVALGSLSIIFAFCSAGVLGLPLSVITWIYAKSDLEDIRSGNRNPDGITLTKTSRILAIIGSIMSFGMFLAKLFG